ncbi:hypothetical protein Tsp_06490 [Trichinella spiralis]|nr:hypothetical protein Tsp_06490 [Trichinella spiralis]
MCMEIVSADVAILLFYQRVEKMKMLSNYEKYFRHDLMKVQI